MWPLPGSSASFHWASGPSRTASVPRAGLELGHRVVSGSVGRTLSVGLLQGMGGHGSSCLLGRVVCSAVSSPFGRSAWTCLLKVLSLISGFTRVSQLPPGLLSSHKSLEFYLLSVDGGQIVVCVGACEPGLLFHSPAVVVPCALSIASRKTLVYDSPRPVCCCAQRQSPHCHPRDHDVYWSPSSNMFLTLSPTCFVSLATLASWLVFEHESCSYPGAFEHEFPFPEYLSRYHTDLFRSLRFHFAYHSARYSIHHP